ncbi:MAG: hypothetical protein ACI9VM_000146 [Candidatus Azotimanducaceae bacterium]|jgi:hypothetical protein
MFRAIGTVIVLFAISQMLSGAFKAFELAVIETFGALEAAALQSRKQINNLE